MTSRRLLIQSLLYHWRSHVAVLLCVAVATSVLAGALLVGDSMRGSLRDITLDRLGRIDFALSSERLFASDLAERFYAGMKIYWEVSRDEPGGDLSEPALLLRGSVARLDESNQVANWAGKVQVCGVNKTFWELNRAGRAPPWASDWDDSNRPDSIVLNDQLASEIGASVGDTVLLRVEKPSDIPREAALGRKDDQLLTMRLTVSRIATPAQFGNFKLDPSQRAPRNAFLPLDRLADAVGHSGQANSLFVSAVDWHRERARIPSHETTTEVLGFLHRALANVVRLDDFGLRLRTDATRGTISLESRRMVLEPAVAAAGEDAASELAVAPMPTVAYLANSITVADETDHPRTIPYSTIAGLPLGEGSPANRFQFREGGPLDESSEDGILLNTWAADDLACRVGDRVTIEYYMAEPTRPFETAERTFRVRGIVEIEGIAADPGLVPDYPGITNAKRYADWNPPFPMDLKRIRPKDEEYWDKYRATPKAFVSLAAAERLWGSRFGKWTSMRFELPADGIADASRLAPTPHPEPRMVVSVEKKLLARLKPEQLGLAFQPVRVQGLAASAGGTDFGGLFIAFSVFLIASAAILIGLVFRLGVERRAKQVGLLLAVGFPRGSVRKLLVAEGLLVSLAGTSVGLAGAAGYAWLVMAGLRTWWFAAVGTSLLRLHASASTLAIGAVASLFLAAVAIALSLRGLTRTAPRTLLAGGKTESVGRPGWSGSVVGFAAVGIAVLFVFVFRDNGTILFFILGMLMLVALLSWVAARVGSGERRPVRGAGFWAVARLGIRNAYRNRTRSVLTIGLVAFATFVIVAVGANRRADDSADGFNAGDRGVVGESSVPLLYDLNTADGRRDLGLPEDSASWLSGVRAYRFRVKEGEDASCLNLYQPKRPRILGVPEEAMVASSPQRAKPEDWLNLKKDLGTDVVPAIGDANSVKWILHLGLGDRLPVVAEDGRTIELQIVGLLDRSVFQSELLISESNFRKLFPSEVGYSVFLFEQQQGADQSVGRAPNGPRASAGTRPVGHAVKRGTASAELSTLLERHLSDYGFDAAPVVERLAEYHAVENTYLATFQMLGGLGLMLGTLGLGAVVLRAVLERRGELALLAAVGYRRSTMAWLVLAETAYLLIVGLVTGSVSAAVAVAPHLVGHAAEVPWVSLSGTLVLVLLFGLLSSTAAVLTTLRTPLLPALRSE